jgi:2-oxoisovalerate dehydrogenase E1 component
MLPVPDLAARLAAFVVERHPFALGEVMSAFDAVAGDRPLVDADGIDGLRPGFAGELARRLGARSVPGGVADVTPRITAAVRMEQASAEVVEACDGCLRRLAIEASLTVDERREILRGMMLTRATDNRLKALYSSGELRCSGVPFQGKGFRSLGQEAVYAAAIRLRRGPTFRGPDGRWTGDVVAPMIRDLGVAMGMRPEPATVWMALNAQAGKAGPPHDGKDLTIGDFDWGVLPPAAPLGIATMTVAGLALAFRLEGSGRVAVSFIGEGGTSLGEWHEAINLCAARRLPAVFCIENNQTALSTPVADQSAVRVFADKAVGYGVPGLTIDGTDPDAVAAAFTWAAERARSGAGPALIELVSMRMCGHAHHDDMLYLGREAPPSWEYAPLVAPGYADRDLYEYWRARDPIATYRARLEAAGVIASGDGDRFRREAEAVVHEQVRALIEAPWPEPQTAGAGVLALEAPRRRADVLDPAGRTSSTTRLPPLDPGPPFDPKGRTFLEAITLGIGDVLRTDPRTFVYGEDVGGTYGNAFLLLRPLLPEHADRLINAPIAEGGVLGVCVGAALAGRRPIGEIQFNDFVATGFNQLVNNAAKIRWRWGADVPMVVRLPWGGLRRAGPYHSQNTEAWFYRTPGLKIVVPSTPHDARALFRAAVADPDPVLYFEHIALYRDPRLRQVLDDGAAGVEIGRAALRCAGDDLAIVSYGAYVHVALRVADRLRGAGLAASVLDLRSLAPVDREAVLALARHCHRVLIVHEDSRTGGIGESLAALIQEEAFEYLDAPVRVLGALDAPVPYSPPLEDYFLPSEADVEREARLLAKW